MSSATASATPSGTRTRAASLVVVALAFAGVTVSVMQTILIPVIPDLPRLLDTSVSGASWTLTATLLASAVATPVAGRLGDMFGKRRVLAVSLVLLIAGSAVCALAPGLGSVLAGRAMQGMASGVVPLGISLMRELLPAERLGSGISLMSSSLGVGGAVGLPVSAVIAEHASWRVLFWVSAGLAALALAGVLAVVPRGGGGAGGRFDLPGAAGLSAGLVCLLLGVSKGADWGWTSPAVLGLAAGAVVAFAAWGRWELRVSEPLVDLRSTARRPVLLTNVASVMVGFAMFATALVFPMLLQLPGGDLPGHGLSMLQAGLCLAPGGLVMVTLSPLSARISARRGPRTTLIAGCLVIAAGYLASMAMLDRVWLIVVAGAVISAGVAIAYAAMPTLVMNAVPSSETGAANGFNTLMRAVGTSVCSALAGVVLAHMTVAAGPVEVPSMGGFRVTLAMGAVAAAAAAGIAAFIPRGGGRREPAASPVREAVPAQHGPAGGEAAAAPGARTAAGDRGEGGSAAG